MGEAAFLSEKDNVLKTKNYQQFRMLVGNRDIDENYLKRLEKNILNNNLLHINPIVVNEKLQVVDGQHRLMVAENNDLDIYFIVSPGLKLKDVEALNRVKKNWNLQDYLNTYVKQWKNPYIRFNEFLNKYPDVKISAAVRLFIGENSKNITRLDIFKQGLLTLNKLDLAEKAAELVYILHNLIPGTKEEKRYIFYYTVIMSLATLIKQPTFDKDIFIKKLKTNAFKVSRQPTQKDYVALFLDIYNYRNNNPLNIKGYKSY